MSGSIDVLDPSTGRTERMDGADAHAAFVAGARQLIPGTEVPMVGPDGGFAGYVPAADVGSMINDAGLRFATAAEVAAHEASKVPMQAFAEGAASSLTLGASDAIARHMFGADPEALKARRESEWGQGGQWTGAGLSMLAGPEAAIGKSLVGKLLPGTVLEKAARAITSEADAALSGLITNEVARGAAAAGLGRAVEGAGYGMGVALSEDGLGDADLSAQTILAGMGAGALIGGVGGAAIETGLGALTRRMARRTGEAAQSVPVGEMDGEKLTAALDAMGAEVDGDGARKWLPYLMTKVSAKLTGAAEEDIARVHTARGREVLLKGARARDDAARALGDLVDRMETQAGKFDLDEARLSRSVLDRIPAQNGDTIISATAGTLRDARSYLDGMIADAANYGRTPEQMRSVLAPIYAKLDSAGSAIAHGAEAGPARKPWVNEILTTPAPAGPRAYISTDRLDLDELERGVLPSVRGVTDNPEFISDFAPGRYLVEAPEQGIKVDYSDVNGAFADGMRILRRVAGEGQGLRGESRAVERLLNETRLPKELKRYGLPKISADSINSPEELADAVLRHWRTKGAAPEQLPTIGQLDDAIRAAAEHRLGGFVGEQESVVTGMAVPAEGTRIQDRKTGKWYTRDEFLKAQGRSVPTATERLADRAVPIDDATAKRAFGELDQLWRAVRAQEGKVKPLVSEVEGLAGLSKRLQAGLQDDGVWGAAATAHRDLTGAAERLATAKANLQRFVPVRDGRADRGALDTFVRSVERVRGDDRVAALRDWAQSLDALGRAAGEHLEDGAAFAKRARQLVGEQAEVYRRVVQDVSVLNSYDRLLRASRDQGFLPSWTLASALGSVLPGGHLVGAAVANSLLNPGRQAMQVASLAAFKNRVEKHVMDRVANLVTPGGAVTKLPLASVPSRLATAMMSGTTAERRAAYDERTAELSHLSDPVAYVDHANRAVGDITDAMPKHAFAMTAAGQTILAYVQSARPSPLLRTSPVLGDIVRAIHGTRAPGEYPSDAEIRRWGELDAIATAPIPTVMGLAEKGMLRAVHMRALNTMYPHIGNQIRNALVPAITKMPAGRKLSAKQQNTISVLLDVPVDTQPRLAAQQALYAPKPEQAAPPPSASGKPGALPRAMMTQADRLATFPMME